MTIIILRPCPRVPHRRHVSTLADDGAERALGWVAFRETYWESHKGERSRTREDAVRKLAEAACLAAPYHVEELAARRRRVVRCGRRVVGITVWLERAL